MIVFYNEVITVFQAWRILHHYVFSHAPITLHVGSSNFQFRAMKITEITVEKELEFAQ